MWVLLIITQLTIKVYEQPFNDHKECQQVLSKINIDPKKEAIACMCNENLGKSCMGV